MAENQDLDARWNQRAEELLKGRTITEVSYMSPEDAEAMGFVRRPVVLRLDNGSFLFAMADDEGSDGGALAVGENDTLPELR